MPWLIRKRDEQYCLYKEGPDGEPTGDTLGCHSTRAEAEAQRRALEVNTQEFSGDINDVMVVWELRGSFPDVPLAPGVDYNALVAGDEDPVFLTLPIGKANVTSGNSRYYDEEWLQELERQALQNKPVGLMGHLKPEDRATAFPDEAVHWVGAARIGELLWGKGYVPPGPVRDRIRRYKATSTAIATSIDAFAEGEWDEGLGAYRMRADTLRLNQIDIAPADRAGIPDLAAVPLLTTEMANENDNHTQEEAVDKLQIIREMTAEDAALLPDDVRMAILATVEPAPEVALVNEMRALLGAKDGDDLKAQIAALKQEHDEQQMDAIKIRVAELVADEETGVKIEALRGLVTELVLARAPQTAEDAEAAYTAVVGGEAVKAALKAHVVETMGPPQGTQVEGKAKRPVDAMFPIAKQEAD